MITKTRTNTHNMNYHLVWCTKYRKKVFITDNDRKEMKKILQAGINRQGWSVSHMEVLPDHIHMLISSPTSWSGSSVVKYLKGHSARLWFEQYPETKKKLWGGHLWMPSYFISTLGDMSKEVVEKYIENQLTEYNHGKIRKDTKF